jgi:hypothetical protein
LLQFRYSSLGCVWGEAQSSGKLDADMRISVSVTSDIINSVFELSTYIEFFSNQTEKVRYI